MLKNTGYNYFSDNDCALNFSTYTIKLTLSRLSKRVILLNILVRYYKVFYQPRVLKEHEQFR